MVKKLAESIREQGLLRAGDRIGVAVSSGADSVALLRALHELRKQEGLVLTVLHFHHGIRGADADRDETFVAALARELKVECVVGRGDVPTHAKLTQQSLETAARELRYRFFESVLRSNAVDKIATAHTMDDQAETVLMRLIRGAGTRGLGGIHATKAEGRFVRPMLQICRAEVETYLKGLGQEWREDATNQDVRHQRNQVRQQLVPLLKRDFNPNVVEVLAASAEIAQAEEEYWSRETERLLPLVLRPGKPTRGGGRKTSLSDQEIAFHVEALKPYPIALQRRLVVAALRKLGIEADVLHVESLISMIAGKTRAADLPGGWKATRGLRELCIAANSQRPAPAEGYAYPLPVPGEAAVPEIKLLVQARLEPLAAESEGYNSGQASLQVEMEELLIRNWRPGDRFLPPHSKGEKRVKEVLERLKVPANERTLWPVVVAGDSLIWVRGAEQRPAFTRRNGRECRLVIRVVEQ